MVSSLHKLDDSGYFGQPQVVATGVRQFGFTDGKFVITHLFIGGHQMAIRLTIVVPQVTLHDNPIVGEPQPAIVPQDEPILWCEFGTGQTLSGRFVNGV